jgi:hypothetical protein
MDVYQLEYTQSKYAQDVSNPKPKLMIFHEQVRIVFQPQQKSRPTKNQLLVVLEPLHDPDELDDAMISHVIAASTGDPDEFQE